MNFIYQKIIHFCLVIRSLIHKHMRHGAESNVSGLEMSYFCLINHLGLLYYCWSNENWKGILWWRCNLYKITSNNHHLFLINGYNKSVFHTRCLMLPSLSVKESKRAIIQTSIKYNRIEWCEKKDFRFASVSNTF